MDTSERRSTVKPPLIRYNTTMTDRMQLSMTWLLSSSQSKVATLIRWGGLLLCFVVSHSSRYSLYSLQKLQLYIWICLNYFQNAVGPFFFWTRCIGLYIIAIAPWRPKTQRRRQARSRPDTVDRPVRTARTFVTLCTIIIVHNIVAQRQSFNTPLPPDHHHISDVAKRR